MQILRLIFLYVLLSQPVYAVEAYYGDVLRAWAVCYEEGLGKVSQIWVFDGKQNKVLGLMPGQVERLVWVDDARLYCAIAAISLPLYDAADARTWSLVPETTWEIDLDGQYNAVQIREKLQRERPFVGCKVQAPKEVAGTLKQVSQAMHSASMAYGYLHQWDFRNAATRYRHAAQQVKQKKLTGVFKGPFEKFSQALNLLSVEAKKDGAGRVCRDHLQVLGSWLLAYADAHASLWPETLSTLQLWVDKKNGHDVLFRCPIDSRLKLDISYIYKPDARLGETMLMSRFHEGRVISLQREDSGFSLQDRLIDAVQLDSLINIGLVSKKPREAVDIFQMVTHIAPQYAKGFCKLGYACLEIGDVVQARTSFERAVDLDHRLAEAYNGLGLVFENHPKGRYDAIRYFRKALQYDENYVEARYNMARIRFALKEHDAKRDLDRVIAQDASFAPAFLLLGAWYEELENDYANAAVAYARYLALCPDDVEGRKRLAATYVHTKDFDRVTSLLEDYARAHPNEIDILPILAQACIDQDRLDWAQAYFSTYVNSAPDTLAQPYKDIQLLASAEEYAEYQSLTPDAQIRFLREFWSMRDPNLTTAANERQLEHYRRVWYALTHFGNGQKPWDRRGGVYIRFGEPDYRSRSDMVNMKQSLSVQRVKERMAQTLYGLESTQLSYFGPVYPVRGLRTNLSGLPDWRAEIPSEAMRNIMQSREQARQTQMGGEEARSTASTQTTGDDQSGFSEEAMGRIASMDVVTSDGPGNSAMNLIMGGGAYAANPFDFRSSFQGVGVGEDASMVRWESWVYTDIGGGIEITFTDENMNGNYDYAPAPLDANIPIRKLALFNRYNPQSVAELAGRLMPDYYVTPDNQAPLQFYYDVVDFRGDEVGRSALEVYMGIPHELGQYEAQEDTTRVIVERVVALLDAETGDVFRRSGQLRFSGPGNLSRSIGAFVPDLVRLDTPPGKYRLEVLVKDRLSGRQGRYRQDVIVEHYGGRGLKVSDLQLAWRVIEGGPQDKFRKQDVHVVPMPTRTYAQGQNVFVYYEIYNLAKDAFGQTKYQVEYTVGAKDDGLGGVVAQLVKVFAGEKNQVVVGYEQVGRNDAETAYTELDLGACDPGRYALKVVVTDLNNGKKTEKEAFFMVAK